MNLATVTAITPELDAELRGKRIGKVFSLSRLRLIIDFRLPDSRFLFISSEPGAPGAYLIARRLRDIEKQSGNPTGFAALIQKRLAGAQLDAVEQIDRERVLLLRAIAHGELVSDARYSLALQFTGRSANIFLLDENDRILDSIRDTRGPGQQPGDIYECPRRTDASIPPLQPSRSPAIPAGGSISQALDQANIEAEHALRLAALTGSAQKKLTSELRKLQRLMHKLDNDLAGHGDADKWKRLGELLLANAASPRRRGNTFVVVDYYDETMPEVEVETDESKSITEAAEDFFKRYAKARKGADEIARRKAETEKSIGCVKERQATLESAIAAGDEEKIASFAAEQKRSPGRKQRSSGPAAATFARTFRSSDGFEILVGKKAKDNDYLTFRLAKSLDLWMHAADYPGSHVVIRNPDRKEVPQSTLLQAAQLAAFYSQGKAQTKAAVHYTQKKFVNKPRGAAPGLVSLASFKTILVVPQVSESVVIEAG